MTSKLSDLGLLVSIGVDALFSTPNGNSSAIISELHSFANKLGFARDSPGLSESLVCDVSRQLNVLHQAASCFSCYDIRDIAIHVYSYSGSR
ncbi:hypothetical protein CSKR_104927 [Clonorchis sinensis]|uniref:Uncharacterized protein n=1 Tax=Clonorchis sinensis TaxID=79923 RepID=A0A419Q717_CLOSI|nr:hypothetical protein CSKR_104927 [Clonorchis sinensis]